MVLYSTEASGDFNHVHIYSAYIVSASRFPHPDPLLLGAYIAVQDSQCSESRIDIVDERATRHVLLYHYEHVLVHPLATYQWFGDRGDTDGRI